MAAPLKRVLVCSCGAPYLWTGRRGCPPIRCPDCKARVLRAREKRYREANREKVLAQHNIRSKRWKEANREKVRADGRAYEAKRREDPEYREKQRLHALAVRKTNPQHVAAIRKRHYLKYADDLRAKARENYLIKTRPGRRAIYDRDAGRCHLCGKKVGRDDFHLDHLIPRSKGGMTIPENLAVSHPVCNQRRGAGRIPAQLILLGN